MKPVTIKILLLCIGSLIIATAVAWGVFDAIPHLEDENAVYFQAKVFASGQVVQPDSPPRWAFGTPFVIDYNGHVFSKYPPGYSLVLAIGMLIHLPWLINPILAALGILAVFLLARELFDEKTALLAAALGVISPMYMLVSGTFLSHTLTLTLLTFFAWAFIRLHRSEPPVQLRYAIACGLLMGFSILTRPWTAVGVGLPFAIYALIRFMRSPRQFWKAYLITASIAILLAGVIPLYNYITTGDALLNPYTLVWEFDTIGFGPEHGRYGYTLQKLWINFKADFPKFGALSMGWPVIKGIPFSWVFLLLGLLLNKRNRLDWALLVPIVTLIVAYMAYWAASGAIYGPRYYFEALPFIWILVARGLMKFDQYPVNYWIGRAALLIFVIWNISMASIPLFDQTRDLYNINRDDSRRIEQADIHHAIVFVHSDYWTEYANFSWKNPINLDSADIIFAKDREEPNNRMIWERYPGRNIYYYNRSIPPYLVPAEP